MSRLAEADAAKEAGDVAKAEATYHEILSKSVGSNEAGLRQQETALIKLGELYRDQQYSPRKAKCPLRIRKVQDLVSLIQTSRVIMSQFAKAKTAKMGNSAPKARIPDIAVRSLIDFFSDVPNTIETQIEVTKDCIAWSVTEKRTFMRLSLQTRLVALYLDSQKYHDALQLSTTLLKELRRLDDKMVLVEVQLLESRVYHALRNIPKSRASLTSARTAANAIYCPPVMQAGLDMQSGILHAEDKDFKTAYSS
jgi:26S proteasome regulatory subunit N6